MVDLFAELPGRLAAALGSLPGPVHSSAASSPETWVIPTPGAPTGCPVHSPLGPSLNPTDVTAHQLQEVSSQLAQSWP